MRSGLLVLAVLAPLVVCASARAGTYDVYSCRLPDGSPAPAGGWTPFATQMPAFVSPATVANNCASGDGLVSTLPSFVPSGVEAGWRFTTPPSTSIDGFELFRAVTPPSDPGGSVAGYVASLGAWPPLDLKDGADERCLSVFATDVPPCDKGLGALGAVFVEPNRYQRSGLHATTLTLGVGCWSPNVIANPGCYLTGAPPLQLTVAAAKLTLRDDSAPNAVIHLAEGATAHGVIRIPVTAEDEGAGLTDTSFMVDGVEGPRVPFEDLPATCGQTFMDPVPCPLRRDQSMPFDARVFADGIHVLQVAVYDAADNRSLSAPVSVRVANATSVDVLSHAAGPNGGGATRFARLRAWLAGRSRKTDRTLGYGATTSVEGQLATTNGAPIPGATLRVEQRAIGVASRPKDAATVTTDKAGHFTYRIARGASRSIRFTYTAFPGDVGPVASAQVSVHVRAGVSLRASPARVRNGTVLTFTGRVLGERGTGRAVVTIYALASGPRKRIPVETFRAAASGRFKYRYRFRSIPGPVTYRFEARVLKQTGLPYVEGASRPVSVRGRP